MPRFAGRTYRTMQDLARIALDKPGEALETFTVAGSYGNVPHGHLEIARTGGFGNVDTMGIMAYEDLLVGAIRCVGSDYLEYAKQAGVDVDAVRLEVIGTWDVRSMGRAFGLKVPGKPATGWQQIVVRATLRTNASAKDAERAHRFAWDNNVAAASLGAVPVRHEVVVEPAATILR